MEKNAIKEKICVIQWGFLNEEKKENSKKIQQN